MTTHTLSDAEIVDKISDELSMLVIRIRLANGYRRHEAEALDQFAVRVRGLVRQRDQKAAAS